MAIVSGIIGGSAIARQAGLDFKGITSGISGIFGGRSEPNAGNESFVDALDNYEGISTSRANLLQNEIIQAIKNGANNRKIGQMVTAAGGYPSSDVTGVMTSWKWPIIQRFVDDIRDQVQDAAYNSGAAGGSGRSGGSVGTGGASGGGGSGGGIPQSLIWGAVGLVMIFVFTGLK